ncbi:MAG: hypothetical protein ACJ780_13360 [Solirubrobacteraceae bacterium]
MTFPPHRFMNLVFAWCVERIADDRREMWEADLRAPLPGREKTAPTTAEIAAEGDDFMATMAMHQARKAG